MKARQQAKKAVGYVRVSTEGQATQGVSMEAQEAKIRAWAAANDHDLVAIRVDEGISGGKVANRPALQEAISEACRQRAALVVYSLSRLARSTRDALEISETLRKAHADLVSLSERIDTTSAAGKMVFRMLAVLAEFERDLVSERTTMALRHLKSQHRRISHNIPFGWELADDGRHLVENKQEQKVIGLICSLHKQGMSLRAIAKELNQRGIRTKKNREFSHVTVYRILKEAA
jgi:DNA invertase Pin-like site-specific DNA recombinase